MDNESSHGGTKSIERLQKKWENIVPVHASWLNQIEIYFSVVQRKVLPPNDFSSLEQVEDRLLAFLDRYQETASPFEWRFTRKDLEDLLDRIDSNPVISVQVG